jgi:hypothetical protein
MGRVPTDGSSGSGKTLDPDFRFFLFFLFVTGVESSVAGAGIVLDGLDVDGSGSGWILILVLVLDIGVGKDGSGISSNPVGRKKPCLFGLGLGRSGCVVGLEGVGMGLVLDLDLDLREGVVGVDKDGC